MRLTYKNPREQAIYMKGYYAGARRITMEHLSLGKPSCVECGSEEDLEIDHIEPVKNRSRPFDTLKDLDNLQIMCKTCNKKKGDRIGK